eukprot:6210503-Pleurochrysis_carterae.AAC.3
MVALAVTRAACVSRLPPRLEGVVERVRLGARLVGGYKDGASRGRVPQRKGARGAAATAEAGAARATAAAAAAGAHSHVVVDVAAAAPAVAAAAAAVVAVGVAVAASVLKASNG